MQVFFIIAMAAASLLMPVNARAQPTEHEAAAQRYIAAMGMRRILTPIVVDYVSVVPVQGRLRVANEIFASLDDEAMNRAVASALVQTYTVQELDAMTAFFGSPVGQSVLDKGIDFMSSLNFAVREQILAAIARAQKRLGQ